MVQTPKHDDCSSRNFGLSSRTLGAFTALQGPAASPCPALAPGDVSHPVHSAFPGKELCVPTLLGNFTASPRAAGTGYGFVSIQHSQAWPCSLAEVCPLRKGHSDLQEVTNLARIRWGPCTRAQTLPHLPWVTQSGSRAGLGKPPERGGAGGSSCCSRRICSA